MTSEAKPVILAVDDDAVTLNAVVSTLKADYSVRPFTGGKAALKFLDGHDADLILLDCQMPVMDGFDVLRELQAVERTRDIPVVFVTGASDGESEVEALDRGAVDYILKPIKPRTLLTRVRLQLELQSHRRRLEALVAEKTRSLNAAYEKLKIREDVILNILAGATDPRDGGPAGHPERVAKIVRLIAEDLLDRPTPGYDITAEQAEDIVKAAKLYELSRSDSPGRMLVKLGLVGPDEYEAVRNTPNRGEQLLATFIRGMDNSFLQAARDIAFSRHERWDGSGHPGRISGSDIPLAGRIVAVADVYDTLTSPAPDKKAFSHHEAVDFIRENGGTLFDPRLVEAFIHNAPRISDSVRRARRD